MLIGSLFIETLVTEPIFFVRIVAILIISITLHELAHGYAALSQGDDTPQKSGHLTLNPVVHMGVPSLIFLCLAGIAWGQMPVNPDKFKTQKLSNIIVSAAGPLANLGLAILALTFLVLIDRAGITWASQRFFLMFARLNIVLCLFNLLPIPPLDGFSVFSEIFPGLKPLRESPFGFFLMTLLFITPVAGIALFGIADWVIKGVVVPFLG